MLARVADARRGVVLPGEAAGELEAAQGLPERGVDNRRSAIGGGRLRYRPCDAQVVRAALARPDVVLLVLERDGRRVIPRVRRRPAGHLVLARGGDAHLLCAAVNEVGRRLRRVNLYGVDAEAVGDLPRVVPCTCDENGALTRVYVLTIGDVIIGSLLQTARRDARLDWRTCIGLRSRVDHKHAFTDGGLGNLTLHLCSIGGGNIVGDFVRGVCLAVSRADPKASTPFADYRRKSAETRTRGTAERKLFTERDGKQSNSAITTKHGSHCGCARGIERR